jgi:hypothetical protein
MAASKGRSGGGGHPSGPPADLAKRALPLVLWPAAAPLYRVHPANRDPIYYGPRKPPSQRFDDPDSRFGTLYVGTNLEIAFVETLLRNPQLRMVAMSEVASRRWSTLQTASAMRLVDFAGAGLNALGTDNGVNTGPYMISRAWAAALHAHPSKPDGIIYVSRHNPAHRCIAVFGKRIEVAAVAPPAHFEADWLWSTLKQYHKLLTD